MGDTSRMCWNSANLDPTSIYNIQNHKPKPPKVWFRVNQMSKTLESRLALIYIYIYKLLR